MTTSGVAFAAHAGQSERPARLPGGEVDRDQEMLVESGALAHAAEHLVQAEADHIYHEPGQPETSLVSVLTHDIEGNATILTIAETPDDLAKETHVPPLVITRQAEHMQYDDGSVTVTEQFVQLAGRWHKTVHVTENGRQWAPIEEPIQAFELSQLRHGLEEPARVYQPQRQQFAPRSTADQFELAA
ncbi:hypothetical protein JNJ66_05355 [Candidatus Saccharibacteria bacterium]|nr:hypothetical protein [Candidatus Saccharibacteria bacterium]